MTVESREVLSTRPINRVSVVVSALNEGNNIGRLFDNIKAQKFPEGVDLKIVISDNGSDEAESLSEYRRLLKDHPDDIRIIRGSKKGFLGAAREYGVKAAVDDYNNQYQSADASKSHIIVSTDADVTIDPKYDFFTNLVNVYKNNPDAALAYGPLPVSTTHFGNIWGSKPVVKAMLRGPEFRFHFIRNKRFGMIDEFVHKPQQIFYGGCEIFTQDAYEQLTKEFTSAFNLRDSTAEDITYSLRAQHIFPRERTIYDRNIVIPFALRHVERENGKLNVKEALKEWAVYLASGSEHLSHKLASTLAAAGDAEKEALIKGLGNLSYRGAVNTFIRGREEAMFRLAPQEHVRKYVSKKKADRLEKAGNTIREGQSSVTGHTLYAVISHAPEDLSLEPHEYVAFYANERLANRIQRREYGKIKEIPSPNKKKLYAVIGQKPSEEGVNYTVFQRE